MPPTTLAPEVTDSARYAHCIERSKQVRWEIDRDVIRGRVLTVNQKFLPDGLSRMDGLFFLQDPERRLMSQVQGRTYANMFGLVERFINAKVLELSRDHWLGDQSALEALVRFSDEELKHQELFRRMEVLASAALPDGYLFKPRPDDVARAVLAASTWAVLALTLHIELFTQAHFRTSIEPDPELSPLWKDVFLYHWKEESQHAVLDELEWRRIDATLTPEARDTAVEDFISLVGAVDGILQAQARADTDYFLVIAPRSFSFNQQQQIEAGMLAAYRWQYILSGAEDPRFQRVLSELATPAQVDRILAALAPLRG
jgi:hypothetical protein